MLPKINRKIPFKEYNNKTDKNTDLSKSKKFCCICFEELQSATIDKTVTRCNHHFCTSCLLKNMKYNNECPLCRTILLSPNKKFCMGYQVSSQIVSQEIDYYNDYIKECIYYVINTIEYHTKNDTLTDEIKDTSHQQILNAFENFGMGICLNVNTTFRNYNVYNTDNSSPPPPPPNDDSPESTHFFEMHDNLVVESQSAPVTASPISNMLQQESVTRSPLPSITIPNTVTEVSTIQRTIENNEESVFPDNLEM